MQMFTCPCCDEPAKPRSSPLSEPEKYAGFAKMLAKGWTAERLLAERSEDLEGIAPGMTDFLRWLVASGAGERIENGGVVQ